VTLTFVNPPVSQSVRATIYQMSMAFSSFSHAAGNRLYCLRQPTHASLSVPTANVTEWPCN